MNVLQKNVNLIDQEGHPSGLIVDLLEYVINFLGELEREIGCGEILVSLLTAGLEVLQVKLELDLGFLEKALVADLMRERGY